MLGLLQWGRVIELDLPVFFGGVRQHVCHACAPEGFLRPRLMQMSKDCCDIYGGSGERLGCGEATGLELMRR